jgi:hypothetical protein
MVKLYIPHIVRAGIWRTTLDSGLEIQVEFDRGTGVLHCSVPGVPQESRYIQLVPVYFAPRVEPFNRNPEWMYQDEHGRHRQIFLDPVSGEIGSREEMRLVTRRQKLGTSKGVNWQMLKVRQRAEICRRRRRRYYQLSDRLKELAQKAPQRLVYWRYR